MQTPPTTCETCKHWAKHSWPAKSGHGVCDRVRDDMVNPDDDEMQLHSGAYAEDHGFLTTGPNFGCTLWEKKE